MLENMVKVEDFAEIKNLEVSKVISMIKSGFYVGRIVDEQWYVREDEIAGVGSTKENDDKYSNTVTISKVLSFIGWLIVLLGVCFYVYLLTVVVDENGGAGAFLAILPSLSSSLFGLILVAFGHMLNTTVDIARSNAEILESVRGGTPNN